MEIKTLHPEPGQIITYLAIDWEVVSYDIKVAYDSGFGRLTTFDAMLVEVDENGKWVEYPGLDSGDVQINHRTVNMDNIDYRLI